MNEFGPYFGEHSALFYDQYRRRRRWETGQQGLHGYAAFLSGTAPTAGGMVAAELSTESGYVRPIVIGVVTSTLAYLVTRWLEKVLK